MSTTLRLVVPHVCTSKNNGSDGVAAGRNFLVTVQDHAVTDTLSSVCVYQQPSLTYMLC